MSVGPVAEPVGYSRLTVYDNSVTHCRNYRSVGRSTSGVKFCHVMSMLESVDDFSSLAEKRQPRFREDWRLNVAWC